MNTGFSPASRRSPPIQEIYRRLSDDPARNPLIADDVQRAVAEGRHSLVLTQRTRHRDHLAELLRNSGIDVIILTSQANAKRREQLQAQLSSPTPAGGRVILATGRLAGEGFDLPRLDTLFLAAPVSWRSVLQQYVGRLHRRHPDKQAVIVYDYVDSGVPQLARMYQRRRHRRTRHYRPWDRLKCLIYKVFSDRDRLPCRHQMLISVRSW